MDIKERGIKKNIIKRDLNSIADSIKNHEPVPVITSEEVETLPKPGEEIELTGYSSNEEELEEDYWDEEDPDEDY